MVVAELTYCKGTTNRKDGVSRGHSRSRLRSPCTSVVSVELADEVLAVVGRDVVFVTAQTQMESAILSPFTSNSPLGS